MNTVADGNNQDNWNCANFACGSDSKIPSQWDNPLINNIENLASILDSKYNSVPESSTSIGDIVHYRLNSQNKTRDYLESELRKSLKSQGYSVTQIDAYINDPAVQTELTNMAVALVADERHFSIVVLKNKSGTQVQNILQKSGKNHFEFKVDDADKVNSKLPYQPQPVSGTSNPYYKKK